MSTTPDGRAWLTSAAIAERIVTALEQAGIVMPEDSEDARAVAESAYKSTGYDLEFKILRLTEKLKDQIVAKELTTVEDIEASFNDIYDINVLEQFDEEGNLIESEE